MVRITTFRMAVDAGNVGVHEHWHDAIRPDTAETRAPGFLQSARPFCSDPVWYYAEVEAPPMETGGNDRVLLRFESVDYWAEVWVNGVMVRTHEGTLPFEADITDALRPEGQNLLAVRVLCPVGDREIDTGRGVILRARELANRAKFLGGVAGFVPNRLISGIIGSVECVAVSALRPIDIHAQADWKTGQVRVDFRLRNLNGQAGRFRCRVEVVKRGACEACVDYTDSLATPMKGDEASVAFQVPNHELWSLENPVFYDVGLRVHDDRGHESRATWTQFGFRDFRVKNGWFYLNGRRIFLKCAHTGPYYFGGSFVPPDLESMTREMRNLKSAGFNAIRFLASVPTTEQIACCDEIGLMVYLESGVGWFFAREVKWGAPEQVFPRMKTLIDQTLSETLRTFRNHPAFTLFGLLNETLDGPVFEHMTGALPLIRKDMKDCVVVLNSGRTDARYEFGSFCNPGETVWSCQWGRDGRVTPATKHPFERNYGLLCDSLAGDIHIYPRLPYQPGLEDWMRGGILPPDSGPVFLSEGGMGNLNDFARYRREYALDPKDQVRIRILAEMDHLMSACWHDWGFASLYPFLDDFLRDSVRYGVKWRRRFFDMVRANPRICGYSLTQAIETADGSGFLTPLKEFKKGFYDVAKEGWAPLRWCLFADRWNLYPGQAVRLVAVLANENVLNAGTYSVTFRVHGPGGTVWEKRTSVVFAPGSDGELPFAVTVIDEHLTLDRAAPGPYIFAADLDAPGVAEADRLTFGFASRPQSENPFGDKTVAVWGRDERIEAYLRNNGIAWQAYPAPARVILVTEDDALRADEAGWARLWQAVENGAYALFLGFGVFAREETAEGGQTRLNRLARLPMNPKAAYRGDLGWLYHHELAVRSRELFADIQEPGLTDVEAIEDFAFGFIHGADVPDTVLAATFFPGSDECTFFSAGLVAGEYRKGRGRYLVQTFGFLPCLGTPTGDLLLRNLLRIAAHAVYPEGNRGAGTQ